MTYLCEDLAGQDTNAEENPPGRAGLLALFLVRSRLGNVLTLRWDSRVVSLLRLRGHRLRVEGEDEASSECFYGLGSRTTHIVTPQQHQMTYLVVRSVVLGRVDSRSLGRHSRCCRRDAHSWSSSGIGSNNNRSLLLLLLLVCACATGMSESGESKHRATRVGGATDSAPPRQRLDRDFVTVSH